MTNNVVEIRVAERVLSTRQHCQIRSHALAQEFAQQTRIALGTPAPVCTLPQCHFKPPSHITTTFLAPHRNLPHTTLQAIRDLRGWSGCEGLSPTG